MRPLFAIFLLLFLSHFGSAAQGFAGEKIERYYTHRTLGTTYSTNIILQGELLHIAKFKYWLNEIAKIPYGAKTLRAIIQSGNNLHIIHDKHARISAGRTRAPMTEDLINGKGADVEILFDANVTEAGSHFVYNHNRELVEYTAVQNLFHELVHARHKMNGTWRYFDSEGQAIEEENIFRKQVGSTQGREPTERVWKTGVPIESITGIRLPKKRTYLIRAGSTHKALTAPM